jgi:hypothetical protein
VSLMPSCPCGGPIGDEMWCTRPDCPNRPGLFEEAVGQTITLAYETIIGGIRFDPGTYEIRRVSEPSSDEPAF